MSTSTNQTVLPASSGGSGRMSPAEKLAADMEHDALASYLLLICGILSIILIGWRFSTLGMKLVRTVACINNEKQRYFARQSWKMSFFKKHFLYAPLFRKRHNREFQLSSAVNVGTLPTRLQFLFLAGYFLTNMIFCLVDIPYNDKSFATITGQIGNRTGTLAVVNMIPLFIMAGRNNPLIPLLGISFDTYNLLHRWFGRIVILESLAHTIALLAQRAATRGWGNAFANVFNVPYLLYGFVATCVVLLMGLQAFGIVRHAFYETFKIVHVTLAIVAVVTIWYHLDLAGLTQIKWLIPVVPLWALERLARLARIGYRNLGNGGSKTIVEALPGDACRVTVTLARPWTFRAGQHAYLYLPSVGLWQSHPFSVAWSDDVEQPGPEKLAMNRHDVLAARRTSVSFVVRARTGFTDKLCRKAADSPGGRLVTTGFVEGPYGGLHGLGSYGTVMLIAGGVGITQQVPHVRELVRGYAEGIVATRRVVLVWVIQSPEHLEWIRPWMTEILSLERRREVLRIMLFISRPRSTKEIHSPSSTVQMFPGRPNLDTLLGIEMEQQVGTMGVSVCGPGSLLDDVRNSVRRRQDMGAALSFSEEAFTF